MCGALTPFVRGSRRRIPGAVLGGLLAGASSGGCVDEVDEPSSCPAEAVGEREAWEPAAIPAEVPACVAAPPQPLALCVEDAMGVTAAEELAIEVSGEITAVGTGKPPSDCVGLDVVGSLLDDAGDLVPPPDDVRWIELDVDGVSWVIALAAPGNTTSLAVGDRVSASIERDQGLSYGRHRFELRDETGDTLWWLAADTQSEPLELTPQCVPLRLGAPMCHGQGTCGQEQHHEIEIDGVAVSPGEQRVVDGLRFTHGGSLFVFDASCSDPLHSWRMLAATRES